MPSKFAHYKTIQVNRLTVSQIIQSYRVKRSTFHAILGCGTHWKSVSLSLTGGRNSFSDVLPEVKALPWLPD